MANKPFSRTKALCMLLACLFFIPVFGALTARFMAFEYERQFHDSVVFDQRLVTEDNYQARHLSYVSVCAQIRAAGNAQGYKEMCSPADEVPIVKYASWVIAGIGGLILLVIYGGRAIAGTNRARLSRMFGFVVRAVMFLLAISVFGQAVLLVFSFYTIETLTIHQVHAMLLATVGFAALFACWTLLRSTFQFFKETPMLIKAVQLDRESQPRLFQFVDDIAHRLGARSPANIIAGLEPNFFVTAGPVALFGRHGTVENETLFISLGTMRLFSTPEFAAVIGHELGHFRGDDVIYSKRFAPAYSRLGQAWSAMASARGGNASDLARLPAIVTLGTCWNVFASVERSIGREREMLADQAGAEASDARSLAHALVKIATHARQWGPLIRAHIDELAEGRMYENLSVTYQNGCRTALGAMDWNAARDELGKTAVAHPVDTHPPLSQRLQGLGTSLDEVTLEAVGVPEESAIHLLQDPEAVEQELSKLEAQWLVAIRAVVIPRNQTKPAEPVGEV